MPLPPAAPDPLPVRLSRRWEWGSRQPISFLMQQAVQNPQVISLAAGLVDPFSLPIDETRSAAAALLSDESLARQALQYGTTQGAERLRRQLLSHLAGLERCAVDELGVGIEQLVLTTGSQQLLSLIGEILLDPDDIVLVAAPTYFAFLGTLNGLGAKAIPVATDDGGLRIDALEAELSRIAAAGDLPRVKLIYVVSDYDNPTGRSLAPDRRRELVALARRWSHAQQIFVLEDAAYREIRFDGPELPSVWSFDRKHETVILAQTFSKSFSPGLRVGYGVVPRSLVAPLCDRKGNEDFGSANFNQHLLATVFERGLYPAHVALVREAYRSRRDAMLEAARLHFGAIDGTDWVHPHGGLYVWMTLPDSIDTRLGAPLFPEAMREGVMYVPGDVCYAGPAGSRPSHQMRLSYGTQTADRIEDAMRRLARAVRTVAGG